MSIRITDTTLRDAHQSLIATRMRTGDMLDVAEKLDNVGFFSLEAWGGATFDTCIRFLNEDPWERLRTLKTKVKNTRVQMLLRGQNLVGYRHYPDDVVAEFIRLAVKNGIDIFRVFDALNDIRNMELAVKEVKKHGAHAQGAICYTTSPIHTIAKFTDFAVQLEKLGCDSICIKDMAGLITPAAATELVQAIKQRIHIPLDLHSHYSSGMASMSYYAATTAGIDILDTAFSAFALGTSQPPTESIIAALKNTEYDTGLDLEIVYEIGQRFAAIAGKYRTLFPAEAIRPDVSVLLHQIPGGMFSNLISQLREQNALNRLNDVLEEVPRVRADMGYPPLVTPTSQLVGIQAVLNVLAGQRYKQVTKEVKDYLLGYYGRPPGEINEDVRESVIGNDQPITGRPADTLKPELDMLRENGHKMGIIHSDEDLITYALYPQVAVKFLRGELKEEIIPVETETPKGGHQPSVFPSEFSVDVDGEVFNVKISTTLGKTITVEKPSRPKELPKGAIVSPMPGMVLNVNVKQGDQIKEDDTVVVIEAMKMQNEIKATHGGTVKKVYIFDGDAVMTGDILMVVE